MKKLSTRNFLFVLLIAASIGSYIYLNTVSINSESTLEEAQIEQTTELENLEGEQQKIILPDVRMIKKIVETGKRLLPAS